MPSLEITINVPLSADEQRTFLAKASKTVAEIVGKPEAVRPLSRSLAPSWPSKLTT